jgi:apolipoprotein N-acyltransferase
VGIALLDGLLAGASPWSRFRRGWLVAAAWLFPGLVWMWDLTAPGYLVAGAVFSTYVGLACVAVPPGRGRRLALPGAVVVAELARWSFPFGGVPLATLAMGQADAPLAPVARIGNALALSGLVAVGGVALAAAAGRRWRPAALGAAVLVGAVALAAVAPRGEVVGTLEAAIVQGGGEQRTRASETDEREVFERHLDLSREIDRPVDVVIWPENVVSVEGTLADSREQRELEDLAGELGAPVIVGTTEGISDDHFLNASVVILPDGQGDRFDKVLRVPFGEYVPFRPVIEPLAGDAGLPRRDALDGDEPAVVDVPLALAGEDAPLGVVISWEIFFTPRARDAARSGGQVVLNPTNGSSYWLTVVQSQQVASSRLRALETGRWVLQAAPTGFSAVVDPDGRVRQRSAVSDPWLAFAEVERIEGTTWANRWGNRPTLAAALALVALGWFRAAGARRTRPAPSSRATTPAPGPRSP